MENLEKLFQDYIVYAGKLREETASVKSVLGQREREIYDSGHKTFDQAVESWVQEFAGRDPSQQELVRALEVILLAAAAQEGKAAYGYLCAVQRHAMVLIPLLDDSSRKTVLAKFEACHPPRQRLPVQREICKMLDQGEEKKRKGLFLFR